MMRKPDRTAWWEQLPAGIRDQIDGYVLQDAMLAAIHVVVDAPHSPADVESLAYRAGGAAGRIVAIEAIWDGDTVHDWFVRLLAITAEPAEEHVLATIYASTAKQYLVT
ncbi:hypothetical protein [Streptomyces goshikiensis]|uniref:hypothetical protein n=1 Tax=Streptomyces goshikiensis TaxID=1942 RepID=UPI0038137DBE